MSDCIQQSDQHTNNRAVASDSKRRGLARLSSASSSSSFDSCSDLLGSLEHAEESLDAQVKQAHEDSQENESKSGVENSVVCDQALQSGDVLPGVALEHMAEGQEFSSPMALEVKDDSSKVEGLSMKDHVYGLSNAISFSKVRSLAGNTVERISQFPTTFRLPLPTSYIFGMKNAVPVSNPLLPDAETDAQTEASNPSKEQPVEGKEVLDINSSSEGAQGEEADPLPEKLSACNPIPVVETTDVSSRDPLKMNSGRSANDSLPVMGNDGTSSKDTVSGTIPGKLLGTESVPTKDAVSMLVGDSVPVTATMYVNTVDAFGNTLGNNTPTVDPCFRNSIDSAGVTEANENSVTDTPKHSDLAVSPQNARSLDMVLEDAPYLPDYMKQVSGEDSDLPQLENSVMSLDLHKKNPVVCHPLRSLSSGSGRPDLEEVDDEQGSASGNKPVFDWNFGSRKAGMLANGHPFELFDNAPNSAEWPSSPDHVQVGNHITSFGEPGLQVENLSVSNNLNEGRKVSVNDQPILAEALEELESSCRQNFSPPEQFCGDILQEDKWRGLSVWLDGNSQEREEKDDLGPDELFRYVENLELNEAYVDTVLDMEDVLLDHDENGSRERFLLASSNSVIGTPRSSRDGSLSSSTSGLQLLTSGDRTPFTVDWVEVVGAKQRRGGSSFGERIVGVKDHTVYCIKVSSGSQEWEVLRRYRDFVDLYHQLRRKFNVRTERSLPGPWKEVDRDSRKVFGSTHPNVIEIRSTRIEKCLQSLLQSGPPLSTSTPLYWFLGPPNTSKSLFGREGNHLTALSASQKGLDVQLGTIEPPSIQSPRSEVGSLKSELDHDKSFLPLGKTVKLNVNIHPNKNLKQLLSAQHHSCAGCYKHLDVDRGLVQGFVQTLGWGKPRLCEYSGQLYCTSCHLNETAVLPAQVLWHWDFTPRRVSQLAKAFLDSIYDQPMLCVSAVNPYLYSRVPILSHVKETRKKLSRMLSCMLCPSRNRISQTMASRRYLLENNDFFALRDLEDLSKGAFAVLPGLLTAVMESLRLHITKQCSVCSETGDWCGAGVLCEEPFSPIYPFEEENITSCKVCHTPFHKACFSSLTCCPACPQDRSKRLGLPGEVEHSQVENFPENGREVDVLALLGVSKEVTASSPSAGETDLQGQFVTDKQSSSHKKWPSFYHLLPKKRLW